MYQSIISGNKTDISLSRRLIHVFKYLYLVLLAKRSYKLRFNGAIGQGYVLKNKLTKQELESYKKYWGRFGRDFDIATIQKVKSETRTFNVGIIPEDIYVADIEPTLNSINGLSLLGNKNIYNRILDSDYMPRVFIHKINGAVLDSNYNEINDLKSYLGVFEPDDKYVLKESSYSSGGKDVFILERDSIEDYLALYHNAVVQEFVKQHPEINRIYDGSICTVRTCVYRQVGNNGISVLNNTIRVGKDGSFDNETAGGLAISIDKDGSFFPKAFDKHGIPFLKHPNSGFLFKEGKLPFYKELNERAVLIMSKLHFARLISFDFCLDQKGDWKLIEINVDYQTIRFSQWSGKPFFQDFTDEVLNFVIQNHWALNYK